MSVQNSLRKTLTSAALAAFTGALAEVTYDVASKRLVANDGVTAGGFPAAKLIEVLLNTTLDEIEAHAGGGQAEAGVLTATINRVTTVASAEDSVQLSPASATNVLQIVINAGANPLQLFGAPSDTSINGASASVGVAIPAGKTGIYVSPAAGIWYGGALT